jgi:predicted LPLAT superfamily acyltransferase
MIQPSTQSMGASAAATRNPGPRWGYAFMRGVQACLPRPVYRLLLGVGAWVAWLVMPTRRRHSRDYLRTVLARAPRWREEWRHFFAFAEFLVLRLSAARGHEFTTCRGEAEFTALMASGEPALMGTFHFGHSDMVGFLLGRYRRTLNMVRLRVGNSSDLRALERQFGEWVRFIWVNEPSELLFALKDSLQGDALVGLQCDRPEHSAKLEPFEFLGARRLFPFTIYHLAVLFDRPVIFSLAVPQDDGRGTMIHHGALFRPLPQLKRAVNLERARAHFQAELRSLEQELRARPWLWFNFQPLNPVAPVPVG